MLLISLASVYFPVVFPLFKIVFPLFPRVTEQRISLPHNSLFVLGWESNREWLHGIRKVSAHKSRLI